MSLPAPNLDDRRFQDIVDEAKRRIARLCPEWTDHNVSDPGVALIELYAWMTEMMLYRLNQVPDRLYLKFLELMGIQQFGPTPARTDILFTLTAPQPTTVRVPISTQVSTERVGDGEPVVFMTERELSVVCPQLISCLTRGGGHYRDQWDTLRRMANRVPCFPTLTPGDAFYLGFSQSLASNLIRLDIVTGVEGAGINPERPPLRWETWNGTAWVPARQLSDTTGALNSPEGGQVTLLLGHRHEAMPIEATRAYWLRCKLIETEPGQPGYRRSPELVSLSVVSLGGAVPSLHADPAPPEFLGVSTGESGQVFQVRRSPVLRRHPTETVRLILPPDPSGRSQEQTWTEVEHFALAADADQVFTWSSATGEIRFGPATYDQGGRAVQHGAIPPADSRVTVTGYRHGGGRRGNVGPRTLTVMRTSIPFVDKAVNLEAATGGVDTESVDNVKVRGPMTLRSGGRAVTADDVERLTADASPAVGRARCIPPGPGEPTRVLIVPRVDIPADSLQLSDLALTPALVSAVAGYLEPRRLLSMQIQIDEPLYQGLMVTARVRAMAGIRPESIREAAVQALYAYINPVTGGQDGRGWPFGAPLNDGDIHALLRSVPGVATVGRVFFFLADLHAGQVRDTELQRVALPPDALLMSYQHQVVVE